MEPTKQDQEAALREFESACNTIALVFDKKSQQRKVALTARGQMREACGEATT